jgi:ABC-type glycerol-3-phosphate transport system substrate-binding protein
MPPSVSLAPAATSAPTEPITITFAATEEERPIYEPLMAAFEAENPGIRVQLVNIEQAAETITMPDGGQMTMIGPGSIRKVVSMADTAVGITPTSEAIAKGWVRDLSPLIDADAAFDRADFYPGLLAPDQAGHIYLLPAKIDVDLLAYNKELWAQRGLPPPKPDWTWSDLKTAAEQLAVKRGSRVEVYGMLDWAEGMPALQAELAEAGVRSDPARPLRLDDPAVVAALERVVALTGSGAYGTEGEFQQLILNQQAGIWAARPNMLDAEHGGNPPKPSFAIGTLPRPLGYGGVFGFLMSGGTAHPIEAWRWLAFLSRQAIGEPLGHGGPAGAVPARPSVAERSGFWKRLDAETTAAFQAALARPTAGQLPELGLDLSGDVLLRGALRAATRGEKAPAAALREAQAALDRLLAQASPTPAPDGDQIVVDTPVPAAPAEAARVTFGAPRPAVDQLRELARAFNQRNPAVVVEIKSIEPAPTLRLANLAAGLDCLGGLGPPGPSDSAALLDLQPLVDADAAFPRDDYPPMLLAPFAQGGRLVGLPYAVDFRVLNYNQTAFDAALLAYPSASWTLDDLLHAAQRLTSGAGQARRYGFASTVVQAQDVFFFLDRAGAATTTGSGATLRPSFKGPDLAQATRVYLDLLRTSSPHQRLSGYTRGEFQTDAVELVSAGRVGMWFDFGAGFFGLGRLPTPDFTHAIAPPPLGDSAVTSNDFRVSGLYIAAQTQHPEACWAWLKYLSEQTAGRGSAFPARRSVVESAAFVSQALPGAAEVYKAYQTAMARTPGGGASETGPEVDYYWFLRAIDRGLQGADLERELDDAQRITEEYLACVQGGVAGGTCAKQVDASYQGWQVVEPGR